MASIAGAAEEGGRFDAIAVSGEDTYSARYWSPLDRTRRASSLLPAARAFMDAGSHGGKMSPLAELTPPLIDSPVRRNDAAWRQENISNNS